MGWFENHMPTVAKLASVIGSGLRLGPGRGDRRGNRVARNKRQDPGAGSTRRSQAGEYPYPSAPGLDADGRTDATPSVGPEAKTEPVTERPSEGKTRPRTEPEPVVAFTVPRSDSSGQLQAAHELGAAFEAALRQAQTAVLQYIEAQDLRERSRSEFAQGQNVWTEAIGGGESAGRYYAARTQSMKSRYEAWSAAFSSALANAQELSEESRQGLRAALDSLNTAIARVAKELEGAAAASSIAGSLLSSAMEELRAVEALTAGERPETQPTNSVGSQAQTEAPAPKATPQLEAPYVLRQELTPEAASAFFGGDAQSSGETTKPRVVKKTSADGNDDPAADTVQAVPAGDEISRITFIPDEVADAPPATDFPGTPGATAAEELQRELQALRPLLADSDPGHDVQRDSVEPVPDLGGQTAMEEPGSPARTEIPKTLGGTLFLMFDAAAAQEHLEEIWDAVEDASGVGTIVDNRLISRAEGVQFTLDLRKDHLDVEAFRMGLPGAEIEQVDDNRLRVNWSP